MPALLAVLGLALSGCLIGDEPSGIAPGTTPPTSAPVDAGTGSGILGAEASAEGGAAPTVDASTASDATVAQTAEAGTAVPATPATAKNDNLRTGWYGNQPGLDPAIVSGPTFGRLFKTQLPLANPEIVLAQPLVSGSSLFVATESNNVYSLDPVTGAINASRELGQPWNGADVGCGDLQTVGITGTPVVDPTTNTVYFFSKTYVNAAAAWYAHALDANTLAEQANFPVEIAGTASNDGTVTFDAEYEMQRTGLLLLNGVVYAGFSAHCDKGTFHGFVVGVSTQGSITGLFATEAGPDGVKGAGIWQAGGGLLSDGQGQILFSTSNGYSTPLAGPVSGRMPPGTLAESFVRTQVQGDGTLQAVDFFQPYNSANLDQGDLDFGAGGPMGLPDSLGTSGHPHLAVAGGKAPVLYVLDRDSLGGFEEGANGGDAVLSQVALQNGLWSSPALWPGDGGWVYVTGNNGPLEALQYGLRDDGVPILTPVGQTSDQFGYTSGSPIVTSNGTNSGSAVVWLTSTAAAWNPGALRAYAALPDDTGTMDLLFEDAYGQSAKFSVPGVGDGRLYVGTSDGYVVGYGTPKTAPISGGPIDFGTAVTGQSVTKTVVLTADQPTQLTAITSSSVAFTVGPPSRGLPLPMSVGDTEVVQVTFTPTKAQEYVAALDLTTGNGPAAVSLRGLGQALGPDLVVAPASISFGGIAVNSSATSSAILTNRGASPVTFSSITLPAAPFATADAPTAGQTLASGASQAITLTFSPTAAGTFSDKLVIGGGGSTSTVYLSGASGAAGNLVITPLNISCGGAVATGTTTPLTFSVKNTGGVNLTVTKSKPPSLGVFVATTTLSEGTVINAGTQVYETVDFEPTQDGAFADQWVITGSNGGGAQSVVFQCLAGSGTGISGDYFAGTMLGGTGVTRVDANIDFDWGAAAPTANITPPDFSVRWEGQIEAVYSEQYTFTTTASDGVRLWVNDVSLVDDWADHTTPAVDTGMIELVAGQKYDLKMEYYNDSGAAVAQLQWSSPSTPMALIPSQFLFPTGYTGN